MLSTQATTKTALAHAIGMDVSQLSKLLRSVTRGSKQSRIRGWIVYQRDTQEITANKKLLAKEGVTV